jgi:hypothetical protein
VAPFDGRLPRTHPKLPAERGAHGFRGPPCPSRSSSSIRSPGRPDRGRASARTAHRPSALTRRDPKARVTHGVQRVPSQHRNPRSVGPGCPAPLGLAGRWAHNPSPDARPGAASACRPPGTQSEPSRPPRCRSLRTWRSQTVGAAPTNTGWLTARCLLRRQRRRSTDDKPVGTAPQPRHPARESALLGRLSAERKLASAIAQQATRDISHVMLIT